MSLARSSKVPSAVHLAAVVAAEPVAAVEEEWLPLILVL